MEPQSETSTAPSSSHEPVKAEDLSDLKIAIPGTLTSAFLALKIHNPDFKYEVVPFDKIIETVQSKRCDAGLLIHEGQLFYESIDSQSARPGRMVAREDWFTFRMGGNVIRRDLGATTIKEVSTLLRESIRYSLDNRDDALQYAMQFARDMDLKPDPCGDVG